MRIARITIGIVLIVSFVAWQYFRHQDPLVTWISSSEILGWGLNGAAWLILFGGGWLIATARQRSRAQVDDASADV